MTTITATNGQPINVAPREIKRNPWSDETVWCIARIDPDGTEDMLSIFSFYDSQEEAQAAIDNYVPAAPVTKPGTYTETLSPIYGEGRVYDDQPGATQYEDGFGGYGVQIWDNE